MMTDSILPAIGSGIAGAALTAAGWIWHSRRLSQKLAATASELDSFRKASDGGEEIVWRLDRDYRCTYVSQGDERLRGFKAEEVVGTSLWDFLKPEGIEHVREVNARRMSREKQGVRTDSIRYELELLCKNGTWIWIEATVDPVRNENGVLTGFQGITRDISDRKQVERVLRESEERYRKLVETAQEGILVAQDGMLAYNNPSFSEVTGYSQEELNGMPFLNFVYVDDRELVLANHRARLAGDVVRNRYHIRIQHRTGRLVWTELSAVKVDWNGRPATLVFLTDITERLEIEQKVRHMAQHDVLTDLPNRALFSDRLQQAIAHAKRDGRKLAVMFVDLDHFKPVNDNIGHDVGDMLLQAVAHRIRGVLRDSDTVARLGGDEFVVLVPSVKDGGDAQMVANRIHLSMMQPFEVGGHTIKISASTGIAIFPDHGENEIDLCKSADRAMYQVKSRGRDGFAVFTSGC